MDSSEYQKWPTTSRKFPCLSDARCASEGSAPLTPFRAHTRTQNIPSLTYPNLYTPTTNPFIGLASIQQPKDKAIRNWCERITEEVGTKWRYKRIDQRNFDSTTPATLAGLISAP